MSLGLVRLRTLMVDGLARNFIVSPHLAEILNSSNTGNGEMPTDDAWNIRP